MTREDQIEFAAYNEGKGAPSFIRGVRWADKHPKSPWISVKERLPEDDFNCIVTNKIAGGTHIAYYLKDDEVWIEAYGRGDEIHGITHWFPKPEFEEE